VRALAENCRPSANTRLYNAPYWNTDAHGRVCLGSMRVPDETGITSLSAWENRCIGGVQALRVDPKCWQRLRKRTRSPTTLEPNPAPVKPLPQQD